MSYTPWAGQTGSGKTYTMLGDSSDLTTAAGPGEAGLIPRICIELFQRLGLTNAERGASSNSYRSGQVSIQVSFCEVKAGLLTKGKSRGVVSFCLNKTSRALTLLPLEQIRVGVATHGRCIVFVHPSTGKIRPAPSQHCGEANPGRNSSSCETCTIMSAYAHPACPRIGFRCLHTFPSDLQRASPGFVRPRRGGWAGVKSKGTPLKGGVCGRVVGETGNMFSAGATSS